MKPILIMAVFMLLLHSCKKPEPYYPLSPEMRALATMKPGSYIVFEDSLPPGVKDSFWVSDFSDYVVRDDLDPKNIQSYDYLRIELTSPSAIIRISTVGSKSKFAGVGFTYQSKLNDSISASSLLATLPVTNGYSENNGFVYTKQDNFFEKLFYINKLYNNVYHCSGNYRGREYQTFYNQEDALIRIEINYYTTHNIWVQKKALIIK